MKYLITILFITSYTISKSQDIETYLSINRNYIELKKNNPISRYSSGLNSYSQTNIGIKTQKNKGYYNKDLGNALNAFFYNLYSEHKDKNLLAYGQLTYTNQTRNNIKWNLIDQNKRFSGYTVADSSNYKRFEENYYLQGAFAKKINKFMVGLNGYFNSKISFGKTDPRPLNKIFDYNFTLHLAYYLTQNYYINILTSHFNYSLRNATNVNKQNIDKSFIVLKPFGLEDKVVNEKSEGFSAVYDGSGNDFGFNIENGGKKGYEFFSKFSIQNYTLDYAAWGKYNEEFYYKNWILEFLYNTETSLLKTIKLKYKGLKNRVNETIRGNQPGNFYNQDKYFETQHKLNLSTYHKIKFKNDILEIIPTISYSKIKIDYDKPLYHHYVDNIKFKTEFNYLKKIKKHFLNIYTKLYARNNIKSDLRTTKDMDFINKDIYNEKIEIGHKQLFHNYLGIDFSTRYDYALTKKYQLFTKLNYHYCKYQEDRRFNEITINLGLRF